jgi:alkylated DNA repair protein alkB family protein 6
MRRVHAAKLRVSSLGIRRSGAHVATTTASLAAWRGCSTSAKTPLTNMSTPSFGDVSNMGNAPDLGSIDTQPAKNVDIKRDLQGPWIMLAGPLQGEVFVREDGYCFYRPGDQLGHGVGKLELTKTAVGSFTFKLELEVYVYEQKTRDPPEIGETYTLVGVVAEATATAQQYKTLTLAGQIQRQLPRGGLENLGALNAAKMTPWDAADHTAWAPNPQILEGFKAIFPNKISLGRTPEMAAKMRDLSPYRVGSAPNVFYVPEYVTAAEEQALLSQLADTPKELKNELDRRVVQEYGCSMCETCNMSFVADVNMPPWSEAVCDQLLRDGIFTPATFPNNVRVHDYHVGHGIAPHCDGPIYIPKVAIVSLKTPVVMSFYEKRAPYEDAMEHYNDTFKFDGKIAAEKPLFSLVLEPRSCIIFQEDVYNFHPHGISDKVVVSLKEEDIGPLVNRHLLTQTDPNAVELVREHRVGITVRHLLSRCNHQPSRTEYCMSLAHATVKGNKPSHESAVAAAAPTSSYGNMSTLPKPTAPPMPVAPPAAVPVASAAPTASPQNDQLLRDVQRSLAAVAATQQQMGVTLKEVQLVLAQSTAHSASFRTEMSSVLDHMSSTMLNLQSTVDDIAERQDEK